MQLSRSEFIAYYKEKYCFVRLQLQLCIVLYAFVTGLLCKLYFLLIS